jgi:hypothetical protein
MENDKEKNEYVTSKDLDRRFGDQTQILLEAFDKRFNKMELHFDKRLDEVRDDLRIDINNLQTLIDGYVKAQEDFKQEFVVMKEEIRKMKMILKEKLGVEISAV